MERSPPTRNPPEWLEAFLEHSRRRTMPAGTCIIQDGARPDSLFYLIKGTVSVLIEDDQGHELILAYLNDGEFFGEMGLFEDRSVRSARVIARTECTIAEATYSDFLQMSDHVPGILFEVARQMSQRLRRTSAKVRDLAFLDVTGRVARCLLDLALQPDAMTHPEGMQVHITRQEIARIVGCSREMVGRVLRDLEEESLIRARGKTIVVLGCR